MWSLLIILVMCLPAESRSAGPPPTAASLRFTSPLDSDSSVASPSWDSADIEDMIDDHVHGYNYPFSRLDSSADPPTGGSVRPERNGKLKAHQYGYESSVRDEDVLGSDRVSRVQKGQRDKNEVKVRSSKGRIKKASINSIVEKDISDSDRGSDFGTLRSKSDATETTTSLPFGMPAAFSTAQANRLEEYDYLYEDPVLLASAQYRVPHQVRGPRGGSGRSSSSRGGHQTAGHLTPAYILTEYPGLPHRPAHGHHQGDGHVYYRTADYGQHDTNTAGAVEYADYGNGPEHGQQEQEPDGRGGYYVIQRRPTAAIALAQIPVVPVPVVREAPSSGGSASTESHNTEPQAGQSQSSNVRHRGPNHPPAGMSKARAALWKRGWERIKSLIGPQDQKQSGSGDGKTTQQQQQQQQQHHQSHAVAYYGVDAPIRYATAGHLVPIVRASGYADAGGQAGHVAYAAGGSGVDGGGSADSLSRRNKDRFVGWTNVDYD